MTNNDLEGLLDQVVYLYISDPWELTSENGTAPHQGKIVAIESTNDDLRDGVRLTVHLDEAIGSKDSLIEYFVAQARQRGNDLADLLRGSTVVVNMVGTMEPSDRSEGDLRQRGVSAIGTLALDPAKLR